MKPYSNSTTLDLSAYLNISSIFKTIPTSCNPTKCSLKTDGSVGCTKMNLFNNDS